MSSTDARPTLIRRFSTVHLLAHLLLAVTFLVMLWTGLCLYFPALAEVMNRPTAKLWHLWAAVALGAGLLVLIVLSRRSFGQLVREVDQLPIGVVEGLGRRARSGSSLGVFIAAAVPGHLRKRNVSFVEEPALVKGQTLAGGFGRSKRQKHGEEEKKTIGRGHFYGLGRAVGVSVQE